jgi:transposase-like protein
MRKLFRKQGFAPEAIVTDKLRSYGAIRELGVSARHEQSDCQNSRAENSHQPKRRRECKMQRTRFSAAQRLPCRFSQYFLSRGPTHPQTPFAREPNAT